MKYFFLSFSVMLFVGCTSPQDHSLKQIKQNSSVQKEYKHNNLNQAIISIADQLFKSNTIKKKDTTLILTSFVDLDNLNHTSTFGRVVSESLFNELHIRKFKVTDFRGQDAISVNETGEFHITRDVEKLKDHISATEYVVVGTYVKFEQNTILLNARILDSETGAIISTSRVLYEPKNCALYNMCIKKKEEIKKPKDFGIDIIPDKNKN